jgi:DeoR family transcriptional regulator of aga operon/DeoR family fructose operon transcriptional repressor
MSSLTADRRNRMAQLLLQEGSIKVGDMAKLFNVSTETIRKDIIYLEEAGIAEKNHGGAIPRINAVEKTLDDKEFINAEDKSAIGMRAAALVHEGDTIILDAGSTTTAIAKQLSMRHGLIIITNSLLIASTLAQSDNEVYLVGGKVRGSSKALVGGWALRMLDSVHADIAFLGSDGFKDLNGPSCLSYEEANVKNMIVRCSRRTYVVADSSKENHTDRFIYADWSEVSGLITSGKQVDEIRDRLKGKVEILN